MPISDVVIDIDLTLVTAEATFQWCQLFYGLLMLAVDQQCVCVCIECEPVCHGPKQCIYVM